MEKEEFLEPEPTPIIDQPHFEEAWTVLAARPVEPLREVHSNHRVRGALKLTAAFVGAGLLGVVVALASIRLRHVPGSVTEPGGLSQSNPAETAPGSAPATEGTAITPEVETVPMKTPTHLTEAPKRQVVQSTASFQKGGETADDSSSAQARLQDEWQERRPRRIRRHRREIDRDLMRIQEIFEGRRP